MNTNVIATLAVIAILGFVLERVSSAIRTKRRHRARVKSFGLMLATSFPDYAARFSPEKTEAYLQSIDDVFAAVNTEEIEHDETAAKAAGERLKAALIDRADVFSRDLVGLLRSNEQAAARFFDCHQHSSIAAYPELYRHAGAG
ncbi:MAG: hypothetical protein KDJ36_00150 [Hyphomicrobiaceae bacterium]|nr:hypothetical protein [Hyphomicrobiaceae bacterium]